MEQGESVIPCDWRVFDKLRDRIAKNEHYFARLLVAQQPGCHPEYVPFDSWYASIDSPRVIRDYGSHWLTRFKGNRHVNPELAETNTMVWLKDYGSIGVFRCVAPNGETEHWVTNEVTIGEGYRRKELAMTWRIAVYHRELKQECGGRVGGCRPKDTRCGRGATQPYRHGDPSLSRPSLAHSPCNRETPR